METRETRNMNHDLLNKLSAVTDEEKKILAGEARISTAAFIWTGRGT